MLQIPAVLIGPQAGGRGYRMLGSSELPRLDSTATAILNAMPLVLAGWADSGEARFTAKIPMGEGQYPAMLLRAKLVGQAVGGSIAFAQGVIVTQADGAKLKGSVEDILSSIPVPDGSSDFASQPLAFEFGTASNAPKHNWAGLGLAWRDRLLLVPDAADAETMALSAINAVEPIEQRPRIRGWATTGALRASGAFAPSRALQLIAIGLGQTSPGSQYLSATVTSAGFVGEMVSSPPTWQTWLRVAALGQEDAVLGHAVARLGWTPQSVELTPLALAKLAVKAVHSAVADDYDAVSHLILRMTADDQDRALVEAARELYTALVDVEPLTRAIELVRLWQGLPLEARLRLGRLDARLVTRPDIFGLSGDLMDRALDLGAARALAMAGIRSQLIVEDANAAWLVPILSKLIDEPDWTSDDAILVCRILLRLESLGVLDNEPEAAYFAVGLGRCLDWTDVPAVGEMLLRATITDAMLARATYLTRSYAKTLLHLPRSTTAHYPRHLRVVQAMLSIVRAASGKVAHESV